MKRILSIFLLLAMLLPLAACGGDEDKTDTPTTTANPADTTVSNIYYEPDDLPEELDFGGEVVRILTEEGIVEEFSVEDLNSDVVNDSIYNRERFVEDRLGVEIEVVGGETGNEIEKQMSSDEDNFQIIAEPVYVLTERVFQGYFVDLYTVDHLNLDKPWWPKHFTEAAELGGNLYIASGSVARSLSQSIWAIYFNKTLTENYSSENPELADVYSLVESGKWTFDKLTELSTSIYNDLNGNSEIDEEDLYGLGFHTWIGTDPLWSSFDINIFSKTDDGWYELDVNTDKLYTALEKIRYTLHDTVGCFTPTDGKSDDSLINEIATKFSGDTLVFMENRLKAAENTILRNMQSDYGILPFPKYDENQKEYYSHAHDGYTALAIPTTNRNIDVAGAVLEAMASYSYRETIPAYLDIALKGQYMSDPTARKMVDTIIDGFTLDTAWMYVYTLGGGFNDDFREVMLENVTTYASTYTKSESAIKKSLKTYKLLFSKFAE